MKDDKHQREGLTGGLANNQPGKDRRQDRLKLALRENLKRRKSQARAKDDTTIAPSNDDEVSLHGESEKRPGE